MPTSDEILLFLIKNAVMDPFLPVEHLTAQQRADGCPETLPLHDLLLRLSGPPRYRVPLPLFEEFVGEKYNFETHIRPLHEAGHIRCNGIAEEGTFYGTPRYRELFAATSGLVSDYSTTERPTWVAFHIRASEKAFLTTFTQVLENAQTLGLRGRGMLRVQKKASES